MKSNFLFLITFLGINAALLIAHFASIQFDFYVLLGFNLLTFTMFILMHLLFMKAVRKNFDQAGMTFMGLTFFGIIIFAIISVLSIKIFDLTRSHIYYFLIIYLIYLGCITYISQKHLANHSSK